MTGDSWFDGEAIPRLERLAGAKVAREVIDLFFEHAPARMEAVRSAGSSETLEEVARALHSLKGSAGMLGAVGLQQLAESMERQAMSNEREDLAARVGELEAAMARLAPILKAERKRIGP